MTNLYCVLSDYLPSKWAPALVNADETGLEQRDIDALAEWLEQKHENEAWPPMRSFAGFLADVRSCYGAEDQALIDEILEDLHDDSE